MDPIQIKKEALEAEIRIRRFIRETPVEYSPYLSQMGSCHVYLKLENIQLTGSFKLRGAANKLLSLSQEEKEKGVVTASTGNHGSAFVYMTKILGIKGMIYLPENASKIKISHLRDYGANLKFFETDCVKTEEFARKTAEKNDLLYISAYNDPQIIGGQATVGIELLRQLKVINVVLVPVGGGGLISGISGYLKCGNTDIKTIGCQPLNSPVMCESIKAGRIIEMESKSTLSDGTAGGIEQGAVTFPICENYVDDFILVTEEEIKDAIKLFLEKHHMLIEGAAALPVASFIKTKKKFKNKNVALIISGAKLCPEKLKEVFCPKHKLSTNRDYS